MVLGFQEIRANLTTIAVFFTIVTIITIMIFIIIITFITIIRKSTCRLLCSRGPGPFFLRPELNLALAEAMAPMTASRSHFRLWSIGVGLKCGA